MANAKTKGKTESIEVQAINMGSVKVRIIGTRPLYQNRMSAKVKQQLLVGAKRKTAAERLNIKHNPLAEYRDSAVVLNSGPTALGIPTVALKAAMCDAAIETAGLTKAGTQRLIFMPDEFALLYGVPQLKCDVVRSADMNKTPDIRTRAFLPRWACQLEVHYAVPQLSAHSIVTLLANAGILIGVGDYRQQKGKGSYGAFRVAGIDDDDEEWNYLTKNAGRKAQEAAIENPDYADQDTEELLDFYLGEVDRRAA